MKRFVEEFMDVVTPGPITIAINDGGKLASFLSNKFPHINVVEKERFAEAKRKLSLLRNITVVDNHYQACWKVFTQKIIICKCDVDEMSDQPTPGYIGGINILEAVKSLECSTFCILVPHNFDFSTVINMYPESVILKYPARDSFVIIIDKSPVTQASEV